MWSQRGQDFTLFLFSLVGTTWGAGGDVNVGAKRLRKETNHAR